MLKLIRKTSRSKKQCHWWVTCWDTESSHIDWLQRSFPKKVSKATWINHNGKEYLKNVYVCIYTHILNHFAVKQKLTQHCKSTILQFKKKATWEMEESV